MFYEKKVKVIIFIFQLIQCSVTLLIGEGGPPLMCMCFCSTDFHFVSCCFAADIVFIVKDKPHPRFRREGLNLIHTANVALGRALTGTTVDIHTLDERILHIPINDIVK